MVIFQGIVTGDVFFGGSNLMQTYDMYGNFEGFPF